ncbi:MAG: hypothetical protein PSV22_18570 [Pseudolabrys sp.]|nr:hypothetical protein [Pseudolabrys sp.]
MTALVFENLTVLPAQAQSLRMLVTRWARTLNKLVSARAARQVPEWRMLQVRGAWRYATVSHENQNKPMRLSRR